MVRHVRGCVAAFIGAAAATTAGAQGEPQGDPARAKAVVVARGCTACHGEDGNGPVPAFPKLAGLQASYLAKQLADFKDSKRPSAAMAPVVAELSAQDMADLAAYFSRNKMAPGAVGDRAALTLGKQLYDDGNPASGVPSCGGCHSPDGSGSRRYPRIAGQSVEYVLGELKIFASGRRRNDRGLMQTVTERMTEREMKAVAEYIASMPEPQR